MPFISSHERASVLKQISLVEQRLREVHRDDRLSAREAFDRWRSLYAELKRLRQVSTPSRFITRGSQSLSVGT